MKNILIIGLCLSFLGCASSHHELKPFVEPQYGMKKQQLTDLLGRPESIEIYKKPDQSRQEFYFYLRSSDASQDKVPVCLIDNKVVGWGKAYYDDHVSPDDIRIR